MYYHLNIKEIDHIVLINKMVHVMFHETVSRKLLIITLYVHHYMSNGRAHNHFWVLFLVLFFFIQISSEQQRKTRSDTTLVMRRLIWICTVCQRPTKLRQCVNELNITPRVLEITSPNFRKRKNLECNL